MASNGKLTTRELVGTLIDLEQDLEFLKMTEEPSESEIESLEKSIQEVKSQMSNKVSGIDYMIVEMTRRSGLIQSEIQSYTDEVKRLRMKQKAIKKTEDYFNQVLLPMIIETAGNDNVFKTDTTKYKLYETWGALEIIDEDAILDKYKRYKVEIDKKGARKDVIEAAENGMGISGFKITKAKRIRRS